jgi:hypothetical protein
LTREYNAGPPAIRGLPEDTDHRDRPQLRELDPPIAASPGETADRANSGRISR